MSETGPATESTRLTLRRFVPRPALQVSLFATMTCLLLGTAFGQMLPGLPQARRDALMQQTRQIGDALFAYATDPANNNAYPDGASSTEVFQKLIDTNAVTDPAIFYTPMPGKTPPVPGQKLKPENVCFDVTSGVTMDTADGLPLVYVTGYRVNYAPGGSAVPLAKPFPAAIMVFSKGASTKIMFPVAVPNTDGSILNFIPASFDAKGKTYRQLTPDGPMMQN